MAENEKNMEDVLVELQAKLAYRNIQYSAQRAYIGRLKKELRLMKTSTSWRLTAPLRKVIERIRRQ